MMTFKKRGNVYTKVVELGGNVHTKVMLKKGEKGGGNFNLQCERMPATFTQKTVSEHGNRDRRDQSRPQRAG